jgi:molybdopterin molybdotransferase
VVPIERTSEADGAVTLEIDAAPGQHVRDAGEDLRAGALVLPAGTPLHAGELGVLVGAGRGEVLCGPRPSVGILATGDELRAPGEPLGPGEIHESNLVTVGALATEAGARVAIARHLPDRREEIESAIADALDTVDVLVLSGGVSVGPHDHVKAALRERGVEEVFWGVALKPGKPTWFGTRGDTLVFGLPGNPVSAMVTFILFARLALRALQGEGPGADLGHAQLGEPVRRNPVREEAVRVRLERRADGLLAMVTGPQESHQTSSMVGADALAIIPRGEGTLEAGTPVELAALLSP